MNTGIIKSVVCYSINANKPRRLSDILSLQKNHVHIRIRCKYIEFGFIYKEEFLQL